MSVILYPVSFRYYSRQDVKLNAKMTAALQRAYSGEPLVGNAEVLRSEDEENLPCMTSNVFD